MDMNSESKRSRAKDPVSIRFKIEENMVVNVSVCVCMYE